MLHSIARQNKIICSFQNDLYQNWSKNNDQLITMTKCKTKTLVFILEINSLRLWATGEMVKKLNLMSALPEDPDSGLSIHMVAQNTNCNPSGRRANILLLPSCSLHCIHTIPRNTYRHITHTQNKISTS